MTGHPPAGHHDSDPGEPSTTQLYQDRFDRAQDRVGRWLHGQARELKPGRRTILRDLLAGLTGAISSVPDGMAAGVLAGVNPAQGLYASLAGPLVGGLTSSTRMMIIATTGAASLAAGSSIADYPADQRPAAMILLTGMAGAVLIIAALLKFNRYIRYVSQSVMLGFLAGISVNIVLSQLPDLLGVEVSGGVPVAKAWQVITHLGSITVPAALSGVIALLLLILFGRTKLAVLGSLAALILPTVAVHLLGAGDVLLVKDGGAIPHGLPLPQLPDFGLFTPGLLGGAIAVAALVIIQGAGVAEAAPNSDGTVSSLRRDVVAQGLSNAGAAAVGGMPVGGSVGQTALNVTAGARSRWAAIWCGLWMAAILVIFSRVVGEVAMPTLAAVLIYAGASSIRPHDLVATVRAGIIPSVGAVATFIAVLALPVAQAVGIGVVASLIMQLNQESLDLRLVRMRRDEDGRVIESPAPATVGPGEVIVLNPYGSMFFAGARTLQRRLPRPIGSEDPNAPGPVVILRLRGRSTLGATFLKVMATYAHSLESVGGELYLTGVRSELLSQWHINEESSLVADVRIYPASEVVGKSTEDALADATRRGRRSEPDAVHRLSPQPTE
ncbi:MAG TPA: SulP family inorganic anion transporter [Microlunatus sp.]